MVIIYSHSNFFYWWPVWVVGYIMAVLSRLPAAGAHQVDMGGGHLEWFNPSKDLGVIFPLTFFLVILITNVTVRTIVPGGHPRPLAVLGRRLGGSTSVGGTNSG